MVFRSDNGPEFVSLALLQWATEKGLRNFLIELGNPWQNGTDEIFNGKVRDECLAMNWFYSHAHAKEIIEAWRKHYSAVRPQSSLDYKTPLGFMSEWANESTNGARVSR